MPVQLTHLLSHICRPPPSATQWTLGPPSSRAPVQHHPAWCRVPGSWGADLAPVFHSRQWSKYCPPFTQVVLLSGRRLADPAWLRSSPQVMGCCPMGAPGDGGGVVPRSVLRLPHLPGCRTIAQGCHPLKKTLLVGKMSTWVCTPGCRIVPPLSLDTSARPWGSPGLGQVPSGLVCPGREVTVMSPTPKHLQESYADIEGRKVTRGIHWTVSL